MEKSKHPTWFKLKAERLELLETIGSDTVLKVISSCFVYLKTREKPENLNQLEKAAFAAFLPDLDEAWGQYLQKITARRSVDIERYQATSSEGEEETEEKTEKEKDIPPKSPRGGNVSAFESFWSAYPKKVGKGAALKAWKKISPGKELTADILAAIEKQKNSYQWKKDDGQFIPNPTTWLNQSRWEDEVDAERKRNSSYDIDEMEKLSFWDPPEEL